MKIITSTPTHSSIPLDQIKGHEKEYNEILGNKNPVKIWALDNKNGWESGGDWYEKYMKIKNMK